MAREIRGWNIGETVTANYMTLNTANIMEQTGAEDESNLPCIYNGLTLQSQSGTGNSIVSFNPGVARCRDLPLATYTYLPNNAYGTSFPCFIDISAMDSNTVITLVTSPTSGYIVATFTIAPNTAGAVNYVITGELQQIATGSYDPAIHVRLCSYTYAASTFTLDFTPGTSRDTDLTGRGGVQWNYQNSSLVLNTPASQSGSAIALQQNTTVNANLTVVGTQILSTANILKFNNSANSHFTSLGAGTSTTDVNFKLPIADASSAGQFITSDMSGNLSFASPSGVLGNVTAGDSNLVFTSSSNPSQTVSPTAARTYTLPSTGIPAGYFFEIRNRTNYLITVQAADNNTVDYVLPKGYLRVESLVSTPSNYSDWVTMNAYSSWAVTTITLGGGVGTPSSVGFYSRRQGGSLFIRGRFTAGTVSSSVGTLQLPYSLNIDTGEISSSALTYSTGQFFQVGSSNANFMYSAPLSGSFAYDGSNTNTLQLINTYNSGPYSNGGFNGIAGSGMIFEVRDIEVPIATFGG